jgi:hypothetical protein
VDRLQQLLAVLDAIPPRLGRSLEEYQRHEETLEAIQGVLADIVSCFWLSDMHGSRWPCLCGSLWVIRLAA